VGAQSCGRATLSTNSSRFAHLQLVHASQQISQFVHGWLSVLPAAPVGHHVACHVHSPGLYNVPLLQHSNEHGMQSARTWNLLLVNKVSCNMNTEFVPVCQGHAGLAGRRRSSSSFTDNSCGHLGFMQMNDSICRNHACCLAGMDDKEGRAPHALVLSCCEV